MYRARIFLGLAGRAEFLPVSFDGCGRASAVIDFLVLPIAIAIRFVIRDPRSRTCANDGRKQSIGVQPEPSRAFISASRCSHRESTLDHLSIFGLAAFVSSFCVPLAAGGACRAGSWDRRRSTRAAGAWIGGGGLFRLGFRLARVGFLRLGRRPGRLRRRIVLRRGSIAGGLCRGRRIRRGPARARAPPASDNRPRPVGRVKPSSSPPRPRRAGPCTQRDFVLGLFEVGSLGCRSARSLANRALKASRFFEPATRPLAFGRRYPPA